MSSAFLYWSLRSTSFTDPLLFVRYAHSRLLTLQTISIKFNSRPGLVQRIRHSRRYYLRIRRSIARITLGVTTFVAFANVSLRVRPEVFSQVIAAREPFLADVAEKALLARVRAQMTLQLVGTRETFAAQQPVADERTLARVPVEMGLEVRRLAVHLQAKSDLT